MFTVVRAFTAHTVSARVSLLSRTMSSVNKSDAEWRATLSPEQVLELS